MPSTIGSEPLNACLLPALMYGAAMPCALWKNGCASFGALAAISCYIFFFQAEDGIRDSSVTGVQTCALPICGGRIRGALAVLGHGHWPAERIVERVIDDRFRIDALNSVAGQVIDCPGVHALVRGRSARGAVLARTTSRAVVRRQCNRPIQGVVTRVGVDPARIDRLRGPAQSVEHRRGRQSQARWVVLVND